MNVNKIFPIILCLIFFHFSMLKAQENIDMTKQNNAIKSINASKSGNWTDVFTNFMQLAAKDLTGDTKSFEYKTTIFAIKAQLDSTLLIDKNYIKERFSRNFQINIGLNLDNDYKFKGFKYGFDWALINKRDLSVNTLVGKESADLYFKYFNIFTAARDKYNNDLIEKKDPERVNKIKQIQKAIDDNKDSLIIPLKEFPKDFIKYLPSDYNDTEKYFNEIYSQDLEDIKRKPLLNVGFHSNFGKDSKFLNEYNANLVYLQGIKSKNGSKMEIDFRSEFKAHDSIATVVVQRREFSSRLGLNISILKKKDQSLIEFKPNFEYKRIFSGLMIDEKNNRFLANADLRVRVLKNLWIPLVLKYDLENNNLFGFLNVSFNFDAIKNE